MSTVENSRASFRPTRARQSLSTGASTINNKENNTTSPAPVAAPAAVAAAATRKRAKSLGGDALEDLRRARDEASSPGKKLRGARMAPRRSILKVTSSLMDHAHTTNFTSSFNMPQSLSSQSLSHSASTSNVNAQGDGDDSDGEDSSDDGNGERDMDLTRMEEAREWRDGAEDRRKSMARRVSFAPNAQIRTFTPDKPTAQAQQLAAAAAQTASSPSQSRSSRPSRLSTGSIDDDSMLESDTSLNTDASMSMEMANADEITRAFTFAGHFGGTVPESGHDIDEDEDLNGPGIDEDAEDDSSSDVDVDGEGGTMAMDLVDEDATSDLAFAAAAAFATASSVGTSGSHGSLDTHAAIVVPLASSSTLPLSSSTSTVQQAGQRTKSRASVCFGGPGLNDNSDDDDEDADDTIDEEDTMDNDRTMAMEMTMVVGSILQTAPTSTHPAPSSVPARVGFAGVLDSDEDDTGPIIAAPAPPAASAVFGIATPSTPTARRQAEVFAKQQAKLGVSGGKGSALKPPMSPRRVESSVSTPLRSAHSNLRGQPPASNQLLVDLSTPTRSTPLRMSIAGTPASTLRLKQQLISLAAANARSPAAALLAREDPVAAVSAVVAAGRSPAAALLHSARESLGGLRMGGTPARESMGRIDSSPAAIRGWTNSPIVGKVKARAAVVGKMEDENHTGSEFGSFDNEQPNMILRLDDFFDSTDMNFSENVLPAGGVNAKGKGKAAKSMSMPESELSTAPPTLADIVVVASARKYFDNLYRDETEIISRAMADAKDTISGMEQSVLQSPPHLFSEWASATGSRREMMQSQFRMIKTHSRIAAATEWNEVRVQNYQSILEAIEADLAGIQADVRMVNDSRFEEVLPSLEQRRSVLMEALRLEKERDVELDACDKDALAELREAMVEQAGQVDAIRSSFAEFSGTLEGLTIKANELGEQESKLMAEVDALRKKTEEGRLFTTSNFFRMNSEFEALQHLHGWTLANWTATTVQLMHVDELAVAISVGRHGLVTSVQMELVDHSGNHFDAEETALTQFLFEKIATHVRALVEDNDSSKGCKHIKAILHRIASLWLCARRLRSELSRTILRYPVTTSHVRPSSASGSSRFRIAIDIHVPTAQASFVVVVDLTGEELFEGDAEEDDDGKRVCDVDKVVSALGVDVRAKFGNVDCADLKYTVRDTLDASGRGALVAACSAAEAKYEE